MSLSLLLVVVAAALLHATWNLAAKQAAVAGPPFVFAYNLFATAAYAPWALWTLSRDGPEWTWTTAAWVVASGGLHLVYSLVLQRGYQQADLSVVYPVARGTGPLLAAVGGFLFFGEEAGPFRLLGLAAVVAGILLIATNGAFRVFGTPRGWTGVRWGAATGGFIAGYTTVDAFAVKVLGVSPVSLDWCSNLFRFVVLGPVVLRRPGTFLDAMRGHWRAAAVVGLISPLGYILVLEAYRRGAPVSVVAPARELSMTAAALLGLVVLREPVGPWRLIGCLILAAGVGLLSVS